MLHVLLLMFLKVLFFSFVCCWYQIDDRMFCQFIALYTVEEFKLLSCGRWSVSIISIVLYVVLSVLKASNVTLRFTGFHVFGCPVIQIGCWQQTRVNSFLSTLSLEKEVDPVSLNMFCLKQQVIYKSRNTAVLLLATFVHLNVLHVCDTYCIYVTFTFSHATGH